MSSRTASAIILALVACLWTACPSDSVRISAPVDASFDANTDATTETGNTPDADADTVSDADAGLGMASWHPVHAALDEAVLAIWAGPDDEVWLVGADLGAGPLVLQHTAADGWVRRETGTSGDLWWVAAPCSHSLYLVGAGGTMLRYDRASEQFVRLPTPSGFESATLYGVWGASCEQVWAVGGHVHPASGPPVMASIAVDSATSVSLPPEVGDEVTLFKVWGTADGVATVVGEQGTMLSLDGPSWAHRVLEGLPRLVTVHGTATGSDRVVVGGVQQAAVLESSDGATWSDVSPGPYAALNGVFVAANGRAAAAGLLGAVFERVDGSWSYLDTPVAGTDWHAALIDGRDDVWVVGGRLLSAPLDGGTVYRYGTARPTLPTTGSPAEIPVVAYSEPVADSDTVDADAVADAGADVDVDVGPDIADADADAVAVVDADATPNDTAADASPSVELSIGSVQSDFAFSAWQGGQLVEIVQGPQGGVHLDVGVQLSLGAEESDTLSTSMSITTTIDGVIVGAAVLSNFPLYAQGGGDYVSSAVPVIFDQNVADPYVNKVATVAATVTIDGVQHAASADVTMVDVF